MEKLIKELRQAILIWIPSPDDEEIFWNLNQLLISIRDKIPPELEPIAIRLLQTELRPGTANNDVNAIRSTAGGLPEGYIVNDFLTSAFAWFLLTNIKGLAYMEREAFEMDMQVEFTTDNLLVKGYERYSFGYYNPRAGYGSFPTS